MPKGIMTTRSTRSSVSSEEDASTSATTTTTTTTRNPEVGTPDGVSVPHVSSQGAEPPQGVKYIEIIIKKYVVRIPRLCLGY